MNKAVFLTVAAVAAGFVFGLAWGQGTRSRLGDAVQTDFSGGKLTVSVDAYKAGREGLADAIIKKWG